jgi:hypothetical protein
MSATVQIRRWTGTTPSYTDITGKNTRANAEDAHSEMGTTNPIQIPSSGSNYSYWVTTRLYVVTGYPPSGTINNIRWYTDGVNSFGTGVSCVVGQASSYVQATGTPGVTGTELSHANHAGLIDLGSGVYVKDAFSFTSASPMSVDGEIKGPNTGDFGNLVVYQVVVGATASPGATPGETLTWKYDET